VYSVISVLIDANTPGVPVEPTNNFASAAPPFAVVEANRALFIWSVPLCVNSMPACER